MVNYRRNYIIGGTYFFTVNLYHRETGLLTKYIQELRQAFRTTKEQYPFQIDAIVILPDHLHTLWTLPNDDDHYPQRWRSIKSQFTRAIKAKGCPVKKNKRGEHYVWQKRYWEHTIRDSDDLQRISITTPSNIDTLTESVIGNIHHFINTSLMAD